MIHVWSSNRLERLAKRLVDGLSAGGGEGGLFTRPPVVVPNLQIAAYLKYEIARHAGIAAGLKFPVSEKFLETLLPSSQPVYRLVDRSTLRSLFLDVLGDSSASGSPLPDRVRSYIDAAGDDAGRDLRRFQLATRLARLARQYGDTRPELLRAWAQGNAGLGDGALSETEDWQRELWARLVGTDGPIDRARERGECRWVLPVELFGVLAEDDGYHPPDEVHVFGFSYVWTGLRELLEHLGGVSDVHVYVLSPSRWEADRASDELNAIRTWERPGEQFAKMLWSLEGAAVDRDWVDSPMSTTLGQLQGEILGGAHGSPGSYQPDDSLVVVGCPGIRREAEVIAGEIWRLIREDEAEHRDAPGRLRFSDFAVLIADSRNRAVYQAHLRAAFDELYAIPYTMVDLPLAGECRTIEAVSLLLALPLGSFTRPELLPLLIHPAVRARFPGADADRWRAWCEQLEIVHGADRLDHAGTYIDRDLFHWEQGLRRLVLGTFLTGPRCGDDRAFPLDGADLLPQDEPVEAQADAARLLLLVRSLVADARYARSARLTLGDWSEFFARLIDAYLAADTDDDAERHALADCLGVVHGLKRCDVGGGPVGYRVAYEVLREAIGELTAAKGHYLADGAAVAPLLEMRALPFRVAFVCGLGEGLFPSLDGPDPLDLSLHKKQTGDVSPRERDQYLFLETLASTRQRLYLSYVSRDAQTGDELEPSPVVLELIRHLDRGQPAGNSGHWIREEPLRRHEKIETPWAPIAAPAARREARASKLRERFLKHCGDDPVMTAERIWELDPALRDWLKVGPPVEPYLSSKRARQRSVSLRQIRQFLECPLQGWARLMLRLREDQDDDPATREDEPFVTGRLPASVLLREVFLEALVAGCLDGGWPALEPLYTRKAEALAQSGVMPVGLFREADRQHHKTCLTAWAESARERELLGHGPYGVRRFGRAGENERVDELGPPIPIDVPFVGADGTTETIRVELHGRTEILSPGLPGSLTCVPRDKPRQKDFLDGFLDAVVLSLIDENAPAEYQVHVLTGSSGGKPAALKRGLTGINAGRARDYLAGVLSEMLGAQHAYLLPCEAVFDYVSKEIPNAASVEAMVEDAKSACSSRWGPVPDFTLYEPPDEDSARAMIERRFGLFRDSGGVGE